MSLLDKVIKTTSLIKDRGLIYTINKVYNYTKVHSNFNLNIYKSNFKEYIDFCEELNLNLRNPIKNNLFHCYTYRPYIKKEEHTKVIAWYLPQYYEIDVNNKFHGKGFTEWTNTSRTIPLFTGHYQPHIPYDLGYYNLTLKSVIKRQIELAKDYGVYGFCFDYYWFSGVRTMEKPVELFLKNRDLDIKFCINWCMENWTQKWDGGKKGVIFELDYKDDDAKRFMNDLIPYINDDRYIRIENKPVVMFYMCQSLPQNQFKKMIQSLREIAKKNGFPDLYIMLCDTALEGSIADWGADALVEYPTYNLRECPSLNVKGYKNKNFKCIGGVLDYKKFVDKRLYWKDYECEKYRGVEIFRSVLLNFDNSSRKAYGDSCWITANSTPELYKKWLSDVNNNWSKKKDIDKNITFVLAWNEWAEGVHLEPDLLYGYSFLNATKEAIEGDQEIDHNIINNKIQICHRKGINKIDFYIHCIESLGDIVACEPIVRYLKNKEPNSRIHWIIKNQFKDLIVFNNNIDEIICVENLGQSIDIVKQIRMLEDAIVIDCHYNGRYCPITGKIHYNDINPTINDSNYLNFGPLLTNFSLTAGLEPINDGPIFYQDPNIELPNTLKDKKYVVLHCKSAEEIKDWRESQWKLLAKYIIDKGFYVVEIGFHSYSKINSEYFLDFTKERYLQKISKIIESCCAFVSVDSGFAHIANCYNKPAVLLFGKYKNFTNPNMYTGNYSNGQKAKIIYAKLGMCAKDIVLEDVKNALDLLFIENDL